MFESKCSSVSKRLPKCSFQFNARTLPVCRRRSFTHCPFKCPAPPPLSTGPGSVYAGAEEDAEQVLNYLKWESLESRKERWCGKKRMIWFPYSKRDEKHTWNTDSMYQTWREGERQTRELQKQQMKDQKWRQTKRWEKCLRVQRENWVNRSRKGGSKYKTFGRLPDRHQRTGTGVRNRNMERASLTYIRVNTLLQPAVQLEAFRHCSQYMLIIREPLPRCVTK